MAREGIKSRLIAAFGEDKVSFSLDILQHYSASIHGANCEPLAIVKPENETEVIRLVKLAEELRFNIFPISRGKNLGYGDAQGTAAGQVILDLSQMNRVIAADDQMCFATIQPGVSQKQLYDHLRANNINLQMDVTGAGLEASIVGNFLERGFGHTNYGDRFSRLINMRIVLMNGEVLSTGFADSSHANAKNTYRFGLGPVLDGLFSQSNFGIITEMTFEMMPAPEQTLLFAISARKEEDISGIICAIRELKLNGVLHSAVHIANKSRAIGSKEDHLLGAWNLSGCIAGPRILVKTQKTLIRKIFRKHLRGHRLVFLNDFRIKLLAFVHRNIKHLSFFPPLWEVFQEQNGIPTDDPLRTLLDDPSATSADISVEKYPICFSWINAVCQADPESIIKINTLLKTFFNSRGYEFRVTMTAVNPRTFILITNITFPRAPDAIAAAKSFKRDCYSMLAENGFYPYRSGSGMFSEMPPYSPVRQKILHDLKKVFDPNGILAPGKYNIG